MLYRGKRNHVYNRLAKDTAEEVKEILDSDYDDYKNILRLIKKLDVSLIFSRSQNYMSVPRNTYDCSCIIDTKNPSIVIDNRFKKDIGLLTHCLGFLLYSCNNRYLKSSPKDIYILKKEYPITLAGNMVGCLFNYYLWDNKYVSPLLHVESLKSKNIDGLNI